MPGRFVRSEIAEQVAEVIGSRQGRQVLQDHGWRQGMPIVMAQPTEPLSDAMALVCVHEPPVLLATLDPKSERLCFTYIAAGCGALEVVESRDPDSTVLDLYTDALQRVTFMTFRMVGHAHSSLAHALPQLTTPEKHFRSYGMPVSGAV